MLAYSSTKTFWDKLTFPFVAGGWLLIPFIGASTNAAHAANPDANTIDSISSFYGLVSEDPIGSLAGVGTFVSDATTDTTALGSKILTQIGTDTTTTSALTTAFSFATGAATVGLGLYAAYKVSHAVLGAKPAPAA